MSDIEKLVAAVEKGDRAAVDAILARDASLASVFDSEGATPLHYATFRGHQEIVDVLLKAGADINARDKVHNATPAGWAINYLRERGALLAIEIEDLRFAIERGDVDWVERLLARHPALAQATDRQGVRLSAHATAGSEIERLFQRYSGNA